MRRPLLLAMFAAVVAPVALAAQRQSDEFRWSGLAARDGHLRVSNVRGNVSVVPARGDSVTVVAARTWQRGRPEGVRIITREVSGDVVICVTTATSCEDARWDSRVAGDVSVDLVVAAPAGMSLAVSTANGDVSVTADAQRVEAQSINGNVAVESLRGTVVAATVNGSVQAWLGDNVNASIRLQAMAFRSDFAIAVAGRVRAGEMRGTIGRGGRSVDLRAVRGAVGLRAGRLRSSR